ncbi:MAG TPA: hybrid sensor histidine kinase/response regulator [Gammaproteobacteria bacterium]|nr:hybrid sensor histidine kinase/response regulator [Gammaproteobacteria bacterium]
MNKNTSLDKAQQILQQLRDNFLDELPERCDAIEEGILALAEDSEGEHFQRLFREVHSLKGSAGTHGIVAISTICHQLEDGLTTAQETAPHAPERIDLYLRYLDLIHRCIEIARDKRGNYAEIDQALEDIRRHSSPHQLSGLIVENSPAMTALYQGALADQPVQLAVEQDGMVALNRLLHERFDLLIMGAETRTLNGIGVLYALRAANGINRHIKVILVSSSQRQNFAKALAPDVLVPRGPEMIPRLATAVAGIVRWARGGGGRP